MIKDNSTKQLIEILENVISEKSQDIKFMESGIKTTFKNINNKNIDTTKETLDKALSDIKHFEAIKLELMNFTG